MFETYKIKIYTIQNKNKHLKICLINVLYCLTYIIHYLPFF